MPDYAVFTKFVGKDLVSKAIGSMDRNVDKFGNSASHAFRKASQSGSRFKDVVKGVLSASAIQKGLGAMSQGLGEATRGFIEFDHASIGAAARFVDIGPDAVDFDAKLKSIKDSARDAGATTQFTAAQAASALDFYARAGFKSAEAIGSLKSMINLATSAGEDFASVADYSTDLLGSFGLSVDNVDQKIANLNRLNDVLAKTANSANVTIESMFETMKTAGPISRVLGIDLETVAAMTGVLGNSGIKGTEGATVLKNGLLNLATMKAPVVAALDAIGVKIADSKGNFRNITDIFEEMGKNLKGMSQIDQAKVLDAIFGKRAIAGSKNLIDGLSGLRELEDSLRSAAGTSERTAEKMRGSIQNRLLGLGSAAMEAAFKIFDSFDKAGRKGISGLTEAIRNFDVTPIVDGLTKTFEIAKKLYVVVKGLSPYLPAIAAGMLTYAVATKTWVSISAAVELFKFAKALKAAAAGQSILNIAMAANPVGIIIVGIAALVASLVYLYMHWERMGTYLEMFFKDAWNDIKQTFSDVFSIFSPLLDMPGIIMAAWKPVGEFFSGLGDKMSKVKDSVSSGFTSAKSYIADKYAGAKNYLGFGVDKHGIANNQPQTEQQRRVEAPNKTEVESREVNFHGELNIAGAPKGSTIKSRTTGAPQIRMNLAGANS